MPIYEYECEKCGHRFEKIQKFSDPPLDTCEKCGAAVHKVQSAPAFQFKGTGWYVTDYAKGKSAGGDDKKPEQPKSESTKSESKDAGTSGSSTTAASSTSTTKAGD